ncbi:MAG: chemotaxis protein CheW [Deltaproteobacteria bacterium]|nr:chemotaxis protein CheW [Deltaproteobacteria bacterium]
MIKASVATSDDQELVQLATLTLGGEEYALDIMRIKEIINPLRITPVPKAPPFIEGVIELRGAIIPVVDMRKRFDMPATPAVRATKYVVISLEGRILGLVVDGVREVLRITRGDLRPAPTLVTGEAAKYFSGVCHHGGRIMMILDIDHILSSQERITLTAMSSMPAPSSPARSGGQAGQVGQVGQVGSDG